MILVVASARQDQGEKMRRKRQCVTWLGGSILGVLTLSAVLTGQASPNSDVGLPVTADWSNQHVIFSRPATAEQAKRVQRDPRYGQQIARHSPKRLLGADTSDVLVRELPLDTNSLRPGRNDHFSGDWSQDLGTGATIGATNYPAKFSLNTTTASCAGAPQPDFVVYGTGLRGSPTQASIAAFDNLYSGCSGTVPSAYWAYSIAAKVATSPVFSRDGTQVAFTEETNSLHGILVLLRWAPSTTESVGSPLPLPAILPGAYFGCVAPCRTTFPLFDLGTPASDTNSSVFYDYGHDVAYVGDDRGYLHKFTPVFLGTPAQVTIGGWPVRVNPGSPTPLNSPVYDSGSGNVFVTDTGGFLYRVGPTAGVTISGQLDFSVANDGGPGLVQGPIVDSTAGLVYVFAASDGTTTTCNVGATLNSCAAVFELSTSFLAGDTGSKAVVGDSTVSGTAPSPLYIGAFDSTYENSADPPTGNLYVCGNTGGDPVLYQVPIVAGSFGKVVAGPALSTSIAATPCSPVTDVLNPNVSGGATEWVFASVQNGGASSGCSSGGCIFNFKDTPWLASTAYTVGQEVLDSNFQTQVVSVAGSSGLTAPAWSTTAGQPTLDGTVVWLDQGVQSASTPAAWAATHLYATTNKILDGNGNIQVVTTPGFSGGSMPTFNPTAGGITVDGVVVWTNAGAIGTAAMPAAGGTSGIIIDNIVGSATEPGASQIYFSTLSGEVCGTSGTGGCAVQASQPALQ
jgi:hypothetical protein